MNILSPAFKVVVVDRFGNMWSANTTDHFLRETNFYNLDGQEKLFKEELIVQYKIDAHTFPLPSLKCLFVFASLEQAVKAAKIYNGYQGYGSRVAILECSAFNLQECPKDKYGDCYAEDNEGRRSSYLLRNVDSCFCEWLIPLRELNY